MFLVLAPPARSSPSWRTRTKPRNQASSESDALQEYRIRGSALGVWELSSGGCRGSGFPFRA